MSSIYACPRDRSHQLMHVTAGYWCPSCIRAYTVDQLERR